MKTNIDLKKLAPCESGYKFAASKNSLIEAWNTCERGDWLLWFAQKLGCPLQLLTLAKGRCAETVISLMCDKRSRKAVEVAIDFGNGNASRIELYAAACAAYDAAANAASYASDYAAAEYAAKAAFYAASDYEADAAAKAAAYATNCAYDVNYADEYAAKAAFYAASDYAADEAANAAACADAADAAADAARKENQQQTANICREILTDFIKSKL